MESLMTDQRLLRFSLLLSSRMWIWWKEEQVWNCNWWQIAIYMLDNREVKIYESKNDIVDFYLKFPQQLLL